MNATVRAVPARREHHAELARLFPELGVDDPVPELERWWAEMASDALFLEADGRALAYGWAQAPSSLGYVRHVIVDPARRGEGLGRRLMHELAARLRARGCGRWQLNVLVDNAPAIALYRSLGMEIDFHTWVVRLPPQDVAHLPHAESELHVVEVHASDDAAYERELEIAPGLLALFRGQQGHRLIALVADEGERLVGLAHFDPAFPGCWPLRARRPEHARALLEALLGDFPPGKPWFQLVIERDQPLTRALLDAGATLRHSIAHMEGPLPAAD